MVELYGKEYADAQSRDLPPKYKELITEWLNPGPEDTILEVGTGGGDIVDFLGNATQKAIGSDVNRFGLAKLEKGNLVTMDAGNLAIMNSSIDKSVSLHVLEHIKDVGAVFSELDRVTKPGGLSYHAFPAFYLTKAEGAYIEAWNTTHNPVEAWNLAHKFHIHKLNPEKIDGFLKGTSWKITQSKKLFVPQEGGFAWNVLLKKN